MTIAIPAEIMETVVAEAANELDIKVEWVTGSDAPFGAVVPSYEAALGFMTVLTAALYAEEHSGFWGLAKAVKVTPYSHGVVLTFPGYMVG